MVPILSSLHATHVDANQLEVNVYNHQPIINEEIFEYIISFFCVIDKVLRSHIRGLGHSFYYRGAIQYLNTLYANAIG